MFKVIKENKIIGVSEQEPVLLDNYNVEEDVEHVVDDYEYNKGQYLLKSEIPAPTQEEQKEKRAQAYLLEKDPITCQIQSLRDEEQTPEIEEEISELLEKRKQVVEDIKKRYPYPVEE